MASSHLNTGPLQDAFNAFAQAGRLSRHGLKCSYAALVGYKPSKQQVQLFLQQQQVDTTGGIDEPCITWEQFLSGMQAVLQVTHEPDEQLRRVFTSFDTDAVGFISRRQAHAAFTNVLPHVAPAVVDQVFDEVDADGDGRVSCRDFMGMMTQRLPTSSKQAGVL